MTTRDQRAGVGADESSCAESSPPRTGLTTPGRSSPLAAWPSPTPCPCSTRASSTPSSSCAGIADSAGGPVATTVAPLAASGPLGERGRREPGTSLSRFAWGADPAAGHGSPRRARLSGQVPLADAHLPHVTGRNSPRISNAHTHACPAESRARRQHVPVVDEAQRFDTRAFATIAVKGRKFGLGLAIASQSLRWVGRAAPEPGPHERRHARVSRSRSRRPARAPTHCRSGVGRRTDGPCADTRCSSEPPDLTAGPRSTAGVSTHRECRTTRVRGPSWLPVTAATRGYPTSSLPKWAGGHSPRRRGMGRPGREPEGSRLPQGPTRGERAGV